MRYLHIGTMVRPVTDEVAREWPAVEAEAEQTAAFYGAHGVVYLRTEAGGWGVIPLSPDFPVTISDEESPAEPQQDVVVAVSSDLPRLQARYPSAPEPELTDDEVAELVRSLKEERPDADWQNLLTGRLAGPASPDRPDVPVWEYPAYLAAHPGTHLDDLTAVRFPVRFFEGPSSVTSVDEELRPPAATARGTRPVPRWTETAETVIGRYAALHDAGVVRWDPVRRGIRYLHPVGSYRAVLHAYAATLQQH